MTEQSSPWDASSGAPADPPPRDPSPPSGPAWGPPPGAAWGPPPGVPGGGGPAWGPPPSPSSTGRTVAIVLGVLGVAGVAFVGLLIGAVTFLGQSSEQKFERVGEPLSTDDDGSDPWADDPYVDDPYLDDPYVDDRGDLAPSEAVSVGFADMLAFDGWYPTSEHVFAPGEPLDGASCAPEGWLAGGLDAVIATFGIDGVEGDRALSISVVTYETEADALADLERARSPEHQECERQQRQLFGPDDASVETLPERPAAPGVAIAITETGGEGRTEYVQEVVVGRMRAQIEMCSCAEVGLEQLEWTSAGVAALLADQQDLPVPG